MEFRLVRGLTISLFILLILVLSSTVISSEVINSSRSINIDNNYQNLSLEAVPSNYIHRPIIEFFTGLSCPACMGGPHQDLERLWNENYENPEQPFTYVVFHELNGGGVDDLATEESKERMRYYQPGVSGTPDAEFDGGYIKLGGFSATSVTYQTASQAIEDCKDRYQRSINPLRPLQSLRNNFKFLELYVDQVFTGNGFAVSVEAQYLGMDNLLSVQNLRGSLFVFMIEDNVEAYSKVHDENVLNHNVFRGYAIKDQRFTLVKDETYSITVEWTIPNTKVPIKPGDITAVAAVYDLDDTSSENGNSGNEAQVPRCIQSATPKSTAYDKDNDVPVISDIGLKYNGELKIDAKIHDDDGISIAYILYNTESANATNWSFEEMELAGEELCDNSGVCYAYGDGSASATISIDDRNTLYYLILAYDGTGVEFGGLGAQGKSEMYFYSFEGGAKKNRENSISFGIIGLLVVVVLILLIFTYFIFIKRQKRSITNNISKTIAFISGKNRNN